MSNPSVVYVLPDFLGGVATVISNVLQFREPDVFKHRVVLTRNTLSTDARIDGDMHADECTVVEYRLPVENLHAVLRRLRRAIGPEPGVLVANDFLELALATSMDCGRTVIQILHGDYDYYYDLAERHQDVVDAFVTVGKPIEQRLKQRLPHRADDIFLLPHPIALPARARSDSPEASPLRLLFVGRLHRDKGVFDLPMIDRALRERGVAVTWTIVGTGSEADALQRSWHTPNVSFLGQRSHAEVLEIAAGHDVFVLPSRFEGVPVAMIEGMSAGVVPVASRLDGVASVLTDRRNGFMPAAGDLEAFVDAIATLDHDRALLESMSAAARDYVAVQHDVRERTSAYQALFARYRELRRPRSSALTLPYGSRLDQPWLPNAAVRTVRSMIRRAKGNPY